MENARKQAIQQVYDYAAPLLAQGQSAAEVQRQLVERGIDAKSAAIVTQSLQLQHRAARREQGKRNMLKGGLWFVAGSLITGITYSLVSGSGGSYVMAWGAILVGGGQLLQGVYQYMRS